MTERVLRRRGALYAAGGLFAYALSLTLTAPASMAAWSLARVTGGMAVLEGAEGGFWRGRAEKLVVAGETGRQAVGTLAWDVVAPRLLRGELAVRLNLGGEAAAGVATLVVTPRALALSQSDFTVPVAPIAAAFPVLQFARPGGRLSFRTDELGLAGETVSGAAQLDWVDASTGLSPVHPLGTYRAKVTAQGGTAQFEVMTVSGALRLSGSGAWSRRTGLGFTGLARADPSGFPQLQPLLKLLGPDNGSGSVQLRFALAP